MESLIFSQIGQITAISILGIVAAFVCNTRCKRLSLAVLFAAVVAGVVFTFGSMFFCMIYIKVKGFEPEGLSYWAIFSFRDIILRMFVPGFAIALVPALVVVLWLRIANSKRIAKPRSYS